MNLSVKLKMIKNEKWEMKNEKWKSKVWKDIKCNLQILDYFKSWKNHLIFTVCTNVCQINSVLTWFLLLNSN